MGAKPLKQHTFTKDGVKHWIRIQRTGNIMPQPARIVIDKEYFSHVGGEYGMETKVIYDKTFADWDYAYGVYRETLKRVDKDSVKETKA